MRKIFLFTVPIIIVIAALFFLLKNDSTNNQYETENESENEHDFDFTKTLTPLTQEEFWRIYNDLKKQHPKGSSDDTGDWLLLGPNGFRINNDPSKLYSGKITNIDIAGNNILLTAANGGLWRNLFIIWYDASGNLPTLQIGAAAMDPANPDIMLAGSGELFGMGGTGQGMFKTTDGGFNWSRVIMTGSFEPSGFSRIIFSRDTVHTATNLGYYRSTNKGNTWSRFMVDVNPQRIISDLKVDPVNSSILYAVVNRDQLGGGGIYKSTNAGQNWIKASGIPDSNAHGALSICDSFNQILFCYLTNANGSGPLGIFRSTNAGLNWTKMNVPQNILSELKDQGFHAYACTVSPVNPNIVMAGGVGLIRTSDGGQSWAKVEGIHADIQNFAWTSGNVYCVNDGGLYFSTNSGLNWTTNANTLPITDFNSISVAGSVPIQVIAGAEHNGSAHFVQSGGNSIWHYRDGGDGGCTQFDPNNDDNIFVVNGVYDNPASMPFRRLRSTDGGLNWAFIENGISVNNACGQWYSSIKSSRIPSPFTNYLYAQVCKTVYRSSNRGDLWTDLDCPLKTTNFFIDEHITVARYGDAYAVSTNATTTQSNKLWVYLTGTNSWADRSPNFPVANRLKRVSVDPFNDFNIYAVYQGINNQNYKVIKSTNKGVNWTNITGTGLGDAPMLEVLQHPGNPNLLYAATERFGMFFSSNGGQQWHPWNQGFPQGAIIADIEIYDSTSSNPLPLLMFVSTYGRGVYFKLLDGDPSVGIGGEMSAVEGFRLDQNYPNPFNPVTKIKFSIPANSSNLYSGSRFTSLKILDITGRQVAMIINNHLQPGEYTVEWNASGYPSGVYYYRLQTGQYSETKKMMLVK